MSEVKLDANGLVTPSISLGDNILSSEDNKLLWNGEEFKSGRNHNVGEQWISMDGTIPFGGLAFLGQTVSKEAYIELYNWVETNNRFKTETEWQSLYTANNGNVSFYAKVDDNTFRLPSFKGYLKANTTAGGYTKEGLPNITGQLNANAAVYSLATHTGAFSKTSINGTARTELRTDAGGDIYMKFDASDSNSIYGNSTHVTPETNTILIGVYAFNGIINPSNLELENLRLDVESLRLDNLNYVTKAGGEISNELIVTAGREAIFRKNGARLYLSTFDDSEFPGSFILRAPKDENCTSYVDLQGHSNGLLTWGGCRVMSNVASMAGSNWYIKYSDGLIIQSGTIATTSGDRDTSTITLPTAFTSATYYANVMLENVDMNGGGGMWTIKSKTTSSFIIHNGQDSTGTFRWFAIGY